jgi:hypothetical protein
VRAALVPQKNLLAMDCGNWVKNGFAEARTSERDSAMKEAASREAAS